MSVAATISKRLKYSIKGRPFSITRFAEVGSRAAVAQALARLVRAGELERITRGIYMRPKFSPYAGWVRPDLWRVLRILAQHNQETLQCHGAEAIRAFQLSTQMQVQPVYYTSGASRVIRIGRQTARLLHVPPEWLQHAGTKVGLALVALFYLEEKEASLVAVAKITSKLTPAERQKLAASNMPAWMTKALHEDESVSRSHSGAGQRSPSVNITG